MFMVNGRAHTLATVVTLTLTACAGGSEQESTLEAVTGEIRAAMDNSMEAMNRGDAGPWVAQGSRIQRYVDNEMVLSDGPAFANAVTTFLASAAEVHLTGSKGPRLSPCRQTRASPPVRFAMTSG